MGVHLDRGGFSINRKSVKRKWFGTDGVRGVANQELTPELAFKLGRVGAFKLKGTSGPKRVLVGRDTRISCDLLESALVAGICSVGVDVVRLGVIPTPGVAYLTRTEPATAGVMISASHNPIEYNGIKFFSSDGEKLPDEVELEIEGHLEQSEQLPRPTGAGVGRVLDGSHLVENYIQFLVDAAESDFSGIEVVLDCANGAAYRVAPEVFRRLNAKVTVLNARPNGVNINVECGSTYSQVVARAVQESGADVGLAFDGDADRLIAADGRGRIVNGDRIIAIIGKDLKARDELPGNTIAGTVMSNVGLEVALKETGIELIRAKVGDRYVLAEMKERGLVLGGEESGHIILLDRQTTGDGILTAVRLLAVAKREGKPLAELYNVMREFPMVLINVRVGDKSLLDKSKRVADAVAEVKARLKDRGLVLVRPSGTEPVVRVMVQAEERDTAKELANHLAAIVKEELS